MALVAMVLSCFAVAAYASAWSTSGATQLHGHRNPFLIVSVATATIATVPSCSLECHIA